jgi:hypothetical protein
MAKDLKNIREIDDHLGGHLDEEHRNEFEKRLREDSGIRDEVNTTRQVIEGIRGASFKEMLKELHSKLFGG